MNANPTRLRVECRQHYDIVIGRGILDDLPGEIPDDSARVLIVHPAALAGQAADVATSLRASGRDAIAFEVPDGEAAKTTETLERGWARLGQVGVTRTDIVMGLGGGTVTDLAGFLAASWLRGIRVIQVPTTLVGMVDAAIGGKTGINTKAGKNLVGAFHQPTAVVCDLDVLASLPRPDLVAGLSEVIKTGFIADPEILSIVESDPAAALDPAGEAIVELVSRSAAVKADVVARDPYEHGTRIILNYGHTLGHAIEQRESFTRRHGEAVAIGMVFAAEVAARLGRIDKGFVERHRRTLASVGLPVSYEQGIWEELWRPMGLDKKNRGRRRRMVVLGGLGRPEVVENADPAILADAYEALVPLATSEAA